MGVRKADGSDLPTRSIPASLVLADEGDDQAYIVYSNFCVLMSYNPALKYALSIGLLSDYFD
jgi:membrane-bound lytic murein transglycosylase B